MVQSRDEHTRMHAALIILAQDGAPGLSFAAFQQKDNPETSRRQGYHRQRDRSLGSSARNHGLG
jgi:hypothetical protein